MSERDTPPDNTATHPVTAYEFPSLAVLKAAHYQLLEAEAAAEDASSPDDSYLQDARDFMRRASATGRILEDEERGVAQTLLNYWATVLIRAGQADNLPSISLVEHDDAAGRDLDDSQCPYIGLDAHTERTAHLFYGRQKLVAEWNKLLEEKRLLVIFGPSGSGKSSLVRAGLVPAFRESRPAGVAWTVVESPLSGQDPTKSMEDVLRKEAKSTRIVIALLRLDEALRYCDKSRRELLLRNLSEWLSAEGMERRVVAAARSDSAATLKPWLQTGKLEGLSGHVILPPFQAVELRAVIEEPANNIGLRFEEGLVETLINEFLGEPAALALLQFTLVKLWAQRERNRITWAGYEKIGGAQFVVEWTAEQVYNSADFSDEDRMLIQSFFPRLVRPSLSRELVVCSVPFDRLASTPVEQDRVKVIVERFSEARLLRIRDCPTGERFVEVAHEALLRKWPRLEQWLDLNRLELLYRQRIGTAALAWREAGKDQSALWSGVQLSSAIAVVDQLSPDEQEFVRASQTWSQRRRQFMRVVLAAIILSLAFLYLREKDRGIVERAAARANEVKLNLEQAERLVERGDPAGAFLFFQNAFAADSHTGWKRVLDWFSPAAWKNFPHGFRAPLEPDQKKMHEFRLATAWPQLPRLTQLLSLSGLLHSALSPDGRYLVGNSGAAVAIWRLDEKAGAEAGEPLRLPLPEGVVKWAAFHPDPAQPLVAIPIASSASSAASAASASGTAGGATALPDHGEVVIFDATTGQPKYPSIKFSRSVPQKAWFAPGAVGDALLVITQPLGGRATVATFWANDFLNAPALLKKLQAPDDPRAGQIWGRLPDSDRRILQEVNTSSELRMSTLVASFNQLIRGPNLHDLPIFTDVRLCQTTLRLLESHPQGDDLARLNRLLLEDLYPDEIRSIRGEVSIWDFKTGKKLAGPLPHAMAVNWASFSPDGKLVVTAAGDPAADEQGEAQVWAWQTGQHATLQHEGGPIAYAEFNAAGDRVVTAEGADDDLRGAARVWSVQQRSTEPMLQVGAVTAPLNHRGAVTRARFSPDGQWVATASRDRTARVWHTAMQKTVLSFSHEGDVTDVLFSPDGRFLATGSRDRTASLWEVATGLRTLAPFNHSETVSELAFDPDGRRLWTTSKFLARAWDLDPREPKAPILSNRESVLVAPSKDGSRIFTVSAPSGAEIAFQLWQVSSGRLLAADTESSKVRVLQAALDASGSRVAISSRERGKTAQIQVFEARTKSGGVGALEKLAALREELAGKEVTLVAFDGAGKRLALAVRDPGRRECQVGVWDLAARQIVFAPRQQPALVSQVQFSPAGDYLLALYTETDGTKGRGKIWAIDGTAMADPSEVMHESLITAAAFSPDGRWLLTGSTDDDARLWPITNRRVLPGKVLLAQDQRSPGVAGAKELKTDVHTHTADVTKVAFSPDGHWALSAAKDQTALLWQMDGTPSPARSAILQHSAYVSDAAFSDDSSLVLTSSDEPKLRVWSVSRGKLIGLFTPLGSVLQTGFAPDRLSLFAIGQSFPNRAASAKSTGDSSEDEQPVREVRPMTWTMQPVAAGLGQLAEIGQLIAARQVVKNELEKVEAEVLPVLWKKEGTAYTKLFPAEPSTRDYHVAAAAECEAMGQWSAAAWQLTQLLRTEKDPAARAALLTRRADAYAKTDDRLGDLPRCIADHLSVIELRPKGVKYAALADVYLAYGAVTRDPAQFDLAVAALRQAATLEPEKAEYGIRLGEAFAGRRNFTQAKAELETALKMKSPSAPARLALVNWLSDDEAGRQRYRDLCGAILEPATESREVYSLLWPSVLTDAFQAPEYAAFREGLVRQARLSLDERPTNLYRRNTYGAALFRAGNYEEAIKELEQARAAYLAERVNELARQYDHLIRVPLWRPAEGRPQDWLFLAMANAMLAAKDPDPVGRANRRTVAWDWMRKAMDAPELAMVRTARPDSGPVLYGTLAIEMLYKEAYKLLTNPPSSPPATQ